MRMRLPASATAAMVVLILLWALPSLAADTRITSADGSFTAVFPVAPEHSLRQSEPGEKLQYSSQIYLAKDGTHLFVAASLVYGTPMSDITAELELNLTNYLKETGASATSQRQTQVTTASGTTVAALEFTAADAGREHRGIFIMPDNSHVYTAIAATQGKADAAMERFIAAFKVSK